MSNSIFDQKIKQMTFNKLSNVEKKSHREKILEEVFSQLTNKKNRYIFYCPDIVVINNLVKLIYETAWEVKELGYSVLILHEINGFKCKWLFEEYKHLKDIDVDYIIKRKSAKSKKTRANYSFRPSDTLIVPDHFQEMLDNLLEVKLIQKVVMVSSYSGLTSLNPGTDYNSLGVSKVLFLEKKLMDDYQSLFTVDAALIDNYPINTEIFNPELREIKNIFPTFCISNIGSNDLTQEVINIFYNKYPQLRTFSFKILPRDNFEYYKNTLKHSALFLVLDKVMGNNQMIFEAMATGIPVATFKRREIEGELNEEIIFGTDAFEIADSLANFAQHWFNLSTTVFEDGMKDIAKKINLEKYNYKNYRDQLHIVIKDLHDNRVKYFTTIKESIKANEVEELETV